MTNASITRAQIASYPSLPSLFTVSGYSVPGDLGAGAQYTSQGVKSSASVSITSASPAVVTWNSHGIWTGSPVVFTGNVPTGITAGTTYYVSGYGAATNTFSVSTTYAAAIAGLVGGCVNTTTAGSGTFSCCASAMAIQNSSGTWYKLITTSQLHLGWFGASGNGSTDDTVAVQTAMDWVGLQSGSSTFNDSIFVDNGT